MANTKVITGPDTLWSYVHVWEPYSIQGSNPKYSVQLRIPKSDTVTLEKIEKAMRAAYEEGASKLKGNGKSMPAYEDLKKPLRDGEKAFPGDAAYEGYMFINANNTQAPGIVDKDRNRIEEHREVYSGCFGRASITFYTFNSNGNKGIACSLNNLQKLKDGPVLGGHSRAEDDFADEDEDFLS